MNLINSKPVLLTLAALSLLGAPFLMAASRHANTAASVPMTTVALQTPANAATAATPPNVAALERHARERWLAQNPSRAHRSIRLGSYDEVAHLVHRSNWDAMNPRHRAMLVSLIRQAHHGHMGVMPCFAPGTDLKTVQAFEGVSNSLQFFRTESYWTNTASGPHALGTPMTLTWSIVPDGTPIASGAGEAADPSSLITKLNAIYGDKEHWLPIIRGCFARWSAVSGVRYIEETHDDGVGITGTTANPGVLGVRGDVRIGSHSIDDSSGILAYNYFPNVSDMVIDADDLETTDPDFPGFFTDTRSNSLGLRNVVEHEHGHGLGFAHTCPINETKLMEPFVSYKFDGPQIDDIQNAQRGNGDTLEENDTQAGGTNLGALSAGVVSKTLLSLDSQTDLDFYRFSTTGGKKISVKLVPLGGSYLEGPQNDNGSCSIGTTFNAGGRRDLKVAVLNNAGNVVAQADATGAGGSENIPPTILAQNTGPFAVRVSGDDKDILQLYSIEITLADYNEGPGLSVSDPTVIEGNSGQTNLEFNVSLDKPVADTVTVKYATSNGTATAGTDYVATTGTLSIPTGQLSGIVKVPVNGDTLDEADETIKLTISNATKAFVLDPEGIGTIVDDDAGPGLSINDVTVAEGDTGTVKATFTVSLAQVSTKSVQVRLNTSDGTATAGSDYRTTTGLISFAPGETSKTFTVEVLGDTSSEANETFFVTLSEAVNSFISRAKGTGTIKDDDQSQVSISDASVTEGDSGDPAVNAVFHVSLKAPSGETIKVNYASIGGTATAGVDFESVKGTLVFAPGELSKEVVVPVKGDAIYESTETFTVHLSSPYHVVIGDGEGVGTISDNDSPPKIGIFDGAALERNSGKLAAQIIVQLSKAPVLENQTVKVNFATVNRTATGGSDYESTRGTLVFGPGQKSKIIEVPIFGDTLSEANETFLIKLSSPYNASIEDGEAVFTINNDDVAPTLSTSNVSLTEGDSGTTDAVFNLKLSTVSGQEVKVHYVTQAGTATEGTDYTYTTGTVTFAPGELTKSVSVPVKGDLIHESTETFRLNISSVVNATASGDAAHGTATIMDNDAIPTISIDDVSVVEGNSGSTDLFFSVKLSEFSSETVKVNYVTRGGTATAGTDYESTSGTLVFPPGEISKLLKITVRGDLVAESDEKFTVELNNPFGATIAKKVGVGTITNDDTATVLKPSAPSS